MGETVNASLVANKVAEEIFKHFHWKLHPLGDQNYKCLNPAHLGDGTPPKPKETHPVDAVFSYANPYTGEQIYLHTDFKSYGKKTIGKTKIRSAIKSLAMSIACARESQQWRDIFSVPAEENHIIHGLLFIHNHDNEYKSNFSELVQETNLGNIDIGADVYIHYLAPSDINRIFSVVNDLIRLQHEKLMSQQYTFFHPDLSIWRRTADIWNQPATIESLSAPYFIVKYASFEKIEPGYVIYYNRQGATHEEFEYFIDCLSRFQILTSEEFIRVRVTHPNAHEHFRSNFLTAKNRYVKRWGFDQTRQQILANISIERIPGMTSNYNPGEVGWKDGK